MATIQVRDVPEAAYTVLVRRARAAGQSLQAYMRDRLVELAEQPTDDELFERVESRLAASGSHVTVEQILSALDAERR
jgi:hypothetical protein